MACVGERCAHHCVCGSQRVFMELILSSHLHVGPTDETQVTRLARQMLLPTEPSRWHFLWVYLFVLVSCNRIS